MSIVSVKKLFLVLLAVLVLAPPSGFSMEIKEIPPLPEYAPLSDEEFKNSTNIVEIEPKEDPELAFRVAIPKEWQVLEDISLRNYIISKKVVGEIARYYSPPMIDLRSSFSVSAMEMEHKITGKNWFIHYVFTNGYTLEGLKVYSDDKVIAHYVLIENDIPYSVRAVALTNGRRIILAQYYVPLKHAQAGGPMQSKVIESFELLNPASEYAEATDTYIFLDLVEFDYPLSWELRTPMIRDIVRMHAFLVNIVGEDRLYGKVDVHAVDKYDTDLATEIKRVNDSLKKSTGFEVGNLRETISHYEFGPHIEAANVEVYDISSKNFRSLRYEYWFAVLSEKEQYNYIITMVTPSREDDFYNWAQNIEVFRFVSESVRPGTPAYERFENE